MHYFGFMGPSSSNIFNKNFHVRTDWPPCNLFDEIMHQVLIPLWDALDVIKNARPETMRWCRDPLLIWRLQATDMAADTLAWAFSTLYSCTALDANMISSPVCIMGRLESELWRRGDVTQVLLHFNYKAILSWMQFCSTIFISLETDWIFNLL